MEKDLINFMEKLEYIGSKDVVKYEDEKGNLLLLPIAQLILSCEYIEAEETTFKAMLFENKADKNIEYNKIKVTKKKDKYEVTKKEKDKGIIVESETEVYQIWLVRNSLQMMKAFNDKDIALAYVNKYNDEILKEAKLIGE